MKSSPTYLSKGFFTFAQNTDKTNYVRLAYLQALSLKASQKHSLYAIGVTPNEKIPDKYKQVFDYVIEVPWEDEAAGSVWKLENEWKALNMTPFDLTLKLDSDMLFFEDISHWWYVLSHYDLVPATEVVDYRGEVSQCDFYRKEITLFNLPNFYSGLFYFRPSSRSAALFEVTRDVFENWDKYKNLYLPGYRSPQATTDIAFAIASKALDFHYPNKLLKFAHMKKFIQDIPNNNRLDARWHISLKYYFNKNMQLFIENFKQRYPVHYYSKDFATESLIAQYEKYLGI